MTADSPADPLTVADHRGNRIGRTYVYPVLSGRARGVCRRS